MRDEHAGEICEKITPGMYVTVSGSIGFNRYDGDLAIDPVSICTAEKPQRMDEAPEKRGELHLHTQMSAMDALTNTKEVVKRAIAWGHPAIAITDHGVAQSFPDAMKAAGDKIKIIYGVEGYYTNDVDDKLAVYGDLSGTLDDEIVIFDIETTGLSSVRDTITEIGAVIMKDAGRSTVSRPLPTRACTFPRAFPSSRASRTRTFRAPPVRSRRCAPSCSLPGPAHRGPQRQL
jgi:DNA polymerase-3 subunit alpha (Gram-positive type)